MGIMNEKPMERIIQESVPGKQVTIAHVIASPMFIGILTLSPYETAIIAADIATKKADVEIGFLDRFTGSVVISGDVQSVETALKAVTDTLCSELDFTTVPITRT